MTARYELAAIAKGRLVIRDTATTKRFRMVEACKRLNEQDAEIKRLTAILAGREMLSAEGQAAGK